MNKNMLISAWALLAIYWGYRMSLPRGIRNNNPSNIEFNSVNDWQGQTGSDGRFSQFDKMENGVRAVTILIINYYQRYGLITVRGIIERFAPSIENETEAYINHVSSEINKTPDQQINLSNDLMFIIRAIIKHENGRNIGEDDLVSGVAMGMVAKGVT